MMMIEIMITKTILMMIIIKTIITKKYIMTIYITKKSR